MTNRHGLEPDNFWTPEFTYETRADGTVLMRQTGALPDHSALLADYLDHWADLTPERTWLARREAGASHVVNGATREAADDARATGEDAADDGTAGDDWRCISYGDARDMARRIGAALLAMGLGPHRPLLILSENSLEHALLGAACMYVGIPYAPVSPAYALISNDHGKLKAIARTLSPGAVFADDGAAFGPALDAIAAPGRVVIGHRDAPADAVLFDDLLRADPAGADEARAGLTAETVVKYLFTSGSTGSPKAVINTNRMICASQAMVRDCYRFVTKTPPVVLDWAPWNHTAGGNKVFYMVMTNGGTFYIDDGRPVPGKHAETLRNLRDVPGTWHFNVPLGYDLLADAMEKDEALAQHFFARLDMLFYAGAGMAQQTWDRLAAIAARVTGRQVLLATGLGATETAPFALACTEVQEKAGNIGVPARGLVLKLVPDAGKLEARLKGPSITPGYLHDPEKTAAAFDDEGFYRLGDALRPADPDDFARGFFFDGRIAENFKLTSGTWVSVGAVRAALVDAMGGLIRDAVITGENANQVGALLLLSDKARAMDAGALHQALTDGLTAAARAATGSASRVRVAVVLEGTPSFARGEVTEKGSLNQRALRDHNAGLIADLHAGRAKGVIEV